MLSPLSHHCSLEGGWGKEEGERGKEEGEAGRMRGEGGGRWGREQAGDVHEEFERCTTVKARL